MESSCPDIDFRLMRIHWCTMNMLPIMQRHLLRLEEVLVPSRGELEVSVLNVDVDLYYTRVYNSNYTRQKYLVGREICRA